MKTDPLKDATWQSTTMPPEHGKGSGKDAWVRFAKDAADVNYGLVTRLKEQTETITDLEAEIVLLRGQISSRKVKGGRPRIADEKVNRIERDLGNGGSLRSIGARHGVSHKTVQRVRDRMILRSHIDSPPPVVKQ